jgi:hypothetical protein
VTLAREPNPSNLGDKVTTATVAASVKGAGMATGTVTFHIGDEPVSSKLVHGVATHTTSKLTIGAHRVTAHSGGDSQFAPRDSEPITQRIVP